jgi:hypothetical protein
MVDTALLVAVIGVGGTLSASVLTVLSEPWRKKKERDAKRGDLRRGLYSELARVVSTFYSLTWELELALFFESLTGTPSVLETETRSFDKDDKRMWELLEKSCEGMLERLESNLEMLDVGVYKLTKGDSDLMVLFYELSEAYVIDSIYQKMYTLKDLKPNRNSIIYQKKHDLKDLEPKEQIDALLLTNWELWGKALEVVERARLNLNEAIDNKTIELPLLLACCTLNEERNRLTELVRKKSQMNLIFLSDPARYIEACQRAFLV